MDPNNARCLAPLARGMIAIVPKDYPAGVPIYVELYSRRTVELAPQDPDVLWRRVAMLAWLGRRAEAEKLAGRCPEPGKEDLWAWEAKWEGCGMIGREADDAAAPAGAQDIARGKSKFIRDSLEQNVKDFKAFSAVGPATRPATQPAEGRE
jgi:hypothetical protein